MPRKAAGTGVGKKVAEAATAYPEAQWVACDDCGKWRTVPGHINLDAFEDEGAKWTCSMNEWDPEDRLLCG